MKFHWMVKGSYSSANILSTVNSIGFGRYESVLLPFELGNNDPMVSAIFLANNFPNQKFMIAVRPYTISARYLSMVAQTFLDYFKNKLIINFVAGTNDDEYKMFTNKIASHKERKDESYKYIKSFVQDLNGGSYSDIAISGASEYSVNSCSEFSAINIALMEDIDKLNKNNRIMLRVSIGVDVDHSRLIGDRELKNSICGTEEHILTKIKELELMGVTDLLISNTYANFKDSNKTHALVDKYKSALSC